MPTKTHKKPTTRKKDKQELEKYREELLKYRSDLTDALKAHAAALPDTGMNGVTGDSSDHATVDYTTELFGTLLEKQSETLVAVEHALDKLNSGKFGICEACEKTISSKRLKALPWAKLCLECQDKKDRAQSRRRL